MVDTTTEKKTGAEDIFWDLSVYYDNPEDPRIDEDFAEVSKLADAFVVEYRGRVAELEAEEIAEAYHKLEQLYEQFGRISTYAGLNYSVYSTDPKWGALMQSVQERSSAIQQKLVFFDLEWNNVPDERAQEILVDPVLRDYAYHLDAERRYKEYQLSEAEEKILIEKDVTGNSAWYRLFNQIISGLELTFKGETMPLSMVLPYISNSPNREEREEAANAVTTALKSKAMELTYIFNVMVADKASDDRLRGYPTWVSSRNLANKASDEVVDALIEAVTDSYDLVARHYEIKKALLGYDELYDYDRYAPLNLKEDESFYTYEGAKDLVLNAFEDFSPQMAETAAQFFDGWIHAPAMAGKRGGAFASYGTKGTHPWVFLNFTGTASDVMTMAHELGHGIHMYLAGAGNEELSTFSMGTPLTTAEMASTFGEMVVFQDMMRREDDKEVQLAMLADKIDGTFATVYRQISMNRFENKLHTTRRSQGELTNEQISQMWLDTQNDMFQGSVTMRDDYGAWWGYVSHFLATPGYVYAYAFGELLVLSLYNIYKETGDDFVPKYLELLASGDSDYPEKLLAKVGVDLEDPNFWKQGIEAIRVLIDEEEALAKELYPEKFA